MQTIRAKLLIPRVTPDLVPRPRLVSRLDEGFARRLTLVSGPAGFGKTTVLGEWIADSSRPVAWVTLDDSDDDLVTFFSYFVAAVRTVYYDSCTETLDLLDAQSTPPTKRLAATLANDLEALPGEIVIVLDDLQCVADLSVYAVLEQVIAYLPPRVHIAIGTRTDPPLPLAMLAARGYLSELREYDLSFRDDEARAFLNATAGPELTPSAAADLAERAEGWAAGLRMLALSARAHDDFNASRGRSVRGDAYAMAYLAAEVLRKQPIEAQEFLLRSSIVERFNASLCAGLEGSGADPVAAEAAIERAIVEKLFLTSLGEGWFRYHPLFRQLLRSRVDQSLASSDVAELHCRAADWYDREGMVRESIAHAVAAGDIAMAVRVFGSHRTEAMNQQHWQELYHWLSLFPAHVVAAEPILAITEAWVEHIRMKHVEVEPTISGFARRLEATEHALEPSIRDSLRGEAATVYSSLTFWSGRFEDSRAFATRALKLLPPDSSEVRGVAYIHRTFGEHYLGRPAAALDVLETAWKEEPGHTGSFPTRLLVTEYDLAFLAFDLPRLERIVSRMTDLSRHRGLVESADWANWCRGRVAYLRNDLVEARDHFEAVMAHRYSTHVYSAYESLLGVALVNLAEGKRDELARSVDELDEFGNETGIAYVRESTVSFKAYLALLEGRPKDALRWADAFDRNTPFVPTARFEYAPVTYAKTLLASGSPDRLAEAAGRLVGLEGTARTCGARVALAEILTLQARLRDLQGDRDSALATLDEAVDLATVGAPVRLFADLGPDIARWLTGYLGELVRRGRPIETVSPILDVLPHDGVRLPDSPETISQRELTVLALLDEGLSNKEIASQLFLSAKTVEGYTSRIYQKLGVRTRREAGARARALHILPLG